MKVLLAVDGSAFTKKAIAYLCANQELAAAIDELVVINVQPPLPERVTAFMSADAAAAWHEDEARRVLDPIDKFLGQHQMTFRTTWTAGDVASEIVQMAKDIKAGMVVMGTHGYGLFGQLLMGSVAQRVVHGSTIPVLLVK